MTLCRVKWLSSDGGLTSTEQTRGRVEFTPITGRTHQLRVHATHELGLNFPIVGAPRYGKGREGDRLMLHAVFLSFFHPATGKKISFSSAPF